MIGSSFSYFQIKDKLGQGGMGEVYRATDSKLNRQIALKVLPDSFARDPQRMARFQREAQVLASLNHPNIASIHGLEEAEGKKALVMELVEGDDLSERLRRGPIPLQEALGIALQIAEALEEAHEHGIVHRDLKPANIKITPEGKVKVLDFGLAKAMEGDPAAGDINQSPTLSLAATQAGVILGTAAYMSPEQARGKPVDRRSDIWAFGTVLFEMLTGKQAFRGTDISEVLAHVITREIHVDSALPDTPAPIRRLLDRCLRRDVRQRLPHIAAARIAIEEYLAKPAEEPVLAPESRAPRSTLGRRLLIPGVGLAALLAGLAIATVLRPAPAESSAPLHLEVTVAGERPLLQQQGSAVVLPRDGRRLAFITGTADPSTTSLHVRSLGSLESEELRGTEGAYNPFFSPDGQWVGFVTPTELKKVSISGGTPLTLCSVNRSRGGDWGATGMIVFAPNPGSGLMLVQAAGGAPRELTALEEGEESHRWPQFLPGGRQVLFTSYVSSDRSAGRLEVVDLDSRERKVVHEGGTYGRYASSGHLLYVNNGTLFAAPFDLDSLETKALAAPVLQEISLNAEGGGQFDVSENGTLVYLTGRAVGIERTLGVADRQGRVTALSQTRKDYRELRLSPDGRRLAIVGVADGNMDIWLHDLERDTQTRLTFEEGQDRSPVWSPDGRFVYFGGERGGKWGLFRKRSDGAGQEEQLTESAERVIPYSISPDGRFLAFFDDTATGGIWTLELDGEGKAEKFLDSGFLEADPVFSPDGNWIAYESNETGRFEVYIRPFPGPGGKWQVSTGGGALARWSKNGTKLYYLALDYSTWEVPVRGEGDSLEVGRPEQLFDKPAGILEWEWEASPGGERFFFVQEGQGIGDSGPNLVKFTFNWFDELRQLLQTQK